MMRSASRRRSTSSGTGAHAIVTAMRFELVRRGRASRSRIEECLGELRAPTVSATRARSRRTRRRRSARRSRPADDRSRTRPAPRAARGRRARVPDAHRCSPRFRSKPPPQRAGDRRGRRRARSTADGIARRPPCGCAAGERVALGHPRWRCSAATSRRFSSRMIAYTGRDGDREHQHACRVGLSDRVVVVEEGRGVDRDEPDVQRPREPRRVEVGHVERGEQQDRLQEAVVATGGPQGHADRR